MHINEEVDYRHKCIVFPSQIIRLVFISWRTLSTYVFEVQERY